MQLKPIPDYITSQGLSDTFLRRFFSRIEYTETCWLWTGYVLQNGYGAIPKGRRQPSGARSLLAHRASWIIHFGPIPEGMFVCHECDIGRCVNPAHLWVGTHQDNMDDMMRKGREAHNFGMFAGEKSYKAKLTWDIVRSIRAEYSPYCFSAIRLAEKYGVVHSVISAILHNEIWKDKNWNPKKERTYKLSQDQMKDIQGRFLGSSNQQALADEFGVSPSTIYNIARIYHKY